MAPRRAQGESAPWPRPRGRSKTTQLRPAAFWAYAAIAGEFARQLSHIELIASENFTYPAVLEAQGSVLTNK